jgi:predicted MFS family arabinose efflux permease
VPVDGRAARGEDDQHAKAAMNSASRPVSFWIPVAAASLLLAASMGSRSAIGLFLGPINTATGLGAATVSLAIAAGLLAFGAAQPAWGAWEGRAGAARVIALGAIGSSAGLALLTVGGGSVELVGAMLLGGASGAALGAPLLMGIVAQRVPVERHGLAMGVISAGSSAGQLAYSMIGAMLISAVGWQTTLLAFAASVLAAAPLARAFGRRPVAERTAAPGATSEATVRQALGDRSYWFVSAGFFVCGFHVSFLTTHMPGVIELCGLPPTFAGLWLAVVGACNIVGSLGAGWLMQRAPMKLLLAAVYALRALGVAAFIALPPGQALLLGFALWMGLTYMATLPLTTGILARLYGARNLAVLFGITMAMHQIGSFLGTWLGGVEFQATGDYRWMWLADILLATAAALVHLPLREREPAPPLAAPLPAN